MSAAIERAGHAVRPAAPAREAHDGTIEYGMRALALMKRHRTTADPIAYEVWYAHVSGREAKLSAEITRWIAEGPLTDEHVRDLHRRHLAAGRSEERLIQIGAGAQMEVRLLLDIVRSALTELASVDDHLSGAAARLAEPDIGAEEARGLLDLAIVATRKVCETNLAMQGRMRDSQASIEALQTELEISRSEAMTDGLTGLFNRRAFDQQLLSRLGRAASDGTPLALLLIDIDHFKLFNDTHGHPIGDQVIKLVGSCLKQSVRKGDVPARYGGEEFGVVCYGRALPEALQVAEALRTRIGGYSIVQQGTQRSLGRVTISVGVAAMREGDTPASLLARADECLYRAKRGGRNRVEADGAAAA